MMDSVDYDKVTRLSHAAVEKTHAQCKRRHVSKLEALLSRSKKKLELRPEGQARWVVNRSLTPSQEEWALTLLQFPPSSHCMIPLQRRMLMIYGWESVESSGVQSYLKTI